MRKNALKQRKNNKLRQNRIWNIRYTSALRALAASPGTKVAAAVARADYREGLFGRWQAAERRLEGVTPLQVEDGVRWNGFSYSYRYFEYGVIRREVEALAARRQHAAELGATRAAHPAAAPKSG